MALAVKLPLASLAAVGAGLVALLLRLRAGVALSPHVVYLAPPPVILAAVLISSRLNIGIRHALPLLPFLYLAAAALAAVLLRHGRRGAAIALCLAILAGAESFAVHPFELSFFNRLAGGSAGGHRFLADSNLDWGQGLKELRADLDRRGLNGRIWLAYFGLPVVDRYGVRAEELPTLTRNTRSDRSEAFDPRSGPALLVVSANEMLGLYRDGPSPWRDLRSIPHRTLAGGSLWVFDAGGNAAIRALVGECYRDAGDAGRAWFHLLGAAALDPHEPLALAGLAHLALDRADAGEARQWLTAAPDGSGEVAVARARLLLAEDRAAAAVAGLTAALEQDRSSYDASLTLALVVLARGGAAPEIGLAAARRASALEPSVALPHDVVASFLARAGDRTGAAAAESAAVDRVTSQERLTEYRRKLAGYRKQASR